MLRERSTANLLLRKWRDDDRAPFAAMNADPRVMEFFPRLLDRAETDAIVDRVLAHWHERGYGPYAIENAGTFIGFVGLSTPTFEAPFMPCVEIGWRLAASHWARGYATEAARAALDAGFTELGLEEIVSFTSVINVRSIRVMEKLGMTRAAGEDFDHPRVPESNPLRRHVLFRARRK
jgi:RimJ/RimL family protein N-acetyltransferase